MVWQGKNNLFCTVQFMQWEYKTATVPEAADAASWLDETIDLPMPDASRDHTKPLGPLIVSIYHENLVVTDKLIAQAEIPLISIFEGEVSSSQYTCEAAMNVEQTAFDGVKFKRKPKGTVKFAAQIVFGAFDPVHSHTKRIEEVVPPLINNMDGIRLDSSSGSIMTHSINPETFREDSMYDFSSQQIRDAADLLQEWEEPPGKQGSGKRDSAAASRSSLHSVSRPISRPASAKDVKVPVPAPAPVRNPASRPSAEHLANKTSPSNAPSESAKKHSPELRASNSAKRSIRVETGGGNLTNTTVGLAVDPSLPIVPDNLNRTAPAAMTRPVSAGIATGGISKPPTRLRNRRSSAADDSLNNTDVDSGKEETGRKIRRGSMGSASNTSKKLKPATDLVALSSTGASNMVEKVTLGCAQRYGNQVIDEAFRLSMKAKGAFLKLNMSELANLLDFINLPVQKKLLDAAAPISNLRISDEEGQKESVTNAQEKARKGEEVSIPIVHAMSLAATISFLVRDHHLLESPGDNHSGSANSVVGVMNEEKSERVLAQLMGLVEGSYPDIKQFILKVCGANHTATRTSSVSTVEPCRPASWSAATVRGFLRSISIKHSTELELTGHEFIGLEGSALRRHFGSNPSIDRTRLSVYSQTLLYLDSWWDRGIRPGEVYQKDTDETAEASLKSGGSIKKNKSKRRGSQAGYESVTAKWGDLSLVLDCIKNDELSETVRARSKVVEGGRAIQTHLLKIANFQVLLEALTPLNRAFGWGCSLESLVRFASIVGGMRGHLWVQDESLSRPQRSNNSSYTDLSQLSGNLLEDIAGRVNSSTQDEIGRWVVLQKGSANSTSELTQLVSLCQELRVVMKYTSREDDFIAFIPLPCLRVTSVQEVRAGVFQAALEGLLLDDIHVGSKVVVASSDALTRTCERFDWWDRPSAQVLDTMSNQVGEVVSLAEAQTKRRVGVRLCGPSGVCDALPLEALRLCSEEEYIHLVQGEEQKASPTLPRADYSESETDKVKPVRRKSRAMNGDSRKNRLRTLIKSLNQEVAPAVAIIEGRSQAVAPPVAPAVRTTRPKSAKINSPQRPTLEELSNKSELSNLSADELTAPPIGNSSPSKKKKPTTVPVSPQKKLIRRTMVRNDPPVTVASKSNGGERVDPVVASFSENDTVREITPNYARSAASSAVVHIRTRPESPANDSLWSEVEPPAIDYSWLKSVPRSPIDLSQHDMAPPVPDQSLPEHSHHPPPTATENRKGHPERKPPPPLHIISAGFDADHAEYTTGVPKVRLDTGDATDPKHHKHNFLRGNRPQSAPSTGNGKSKRGVDGNAADRGAHKEAPSPVPTGERGGFGLSGMGYVGNGQLQQHANQWVNEDIPVIPEAEVPRVIPNKHPIHHVDYRTNTTKLFEFNKKALAPEIEHAQGGNHFGSAGDQMAAQNEALSPPRRVTKTTTAVPQRPRSANATAGRGVVNPHKAGQKTLGEVLKDFPLQAGDEPDNENAEHTKQGTRPMEHPKRTREEQLAHIAAAKSAKELSLQEKVLQKELKRLQKH